jgi:hypothetical protein
MFSVAKVGAFVDSYRPGVEKRGQDEASVLKVKFRIEPFDAKLATALDEGVGGDCNVRSTVFSMTTSEPKKNFTRHDFKLGLPRQTLELFASPDTPGSRVALNQAKISNIIVRAEKGTNALVLGFVATFGPVGRDELEIVHSLHRMQTFITFHEGEPVLPTESASDEEGDEADVIAQNTQIEFQVGEEVAGEAIEPASEGPTTREIGSRRRLHSHQAGKKKTRRRRPAAEDTEPEGDEASI